MAWPHVFIQNDPATAQISKLQAQTLGQKGVPNKKKFFKENHCFQNTKLTNMLVPNFLGEGGILKF